jgi:hypothetical protein
VDALIVQLPALVGVLIGTLGTILATQLRDRAQWRRGQSIRWDDRRLDAYAEYARALKEVHLLSTRLTAHSRPSSQSHPIDREAGLKLLAEADAERTKAWERVLLLGDAATVAAAREWRDVVLQLELSARGRARKGFEWIPAVRRADEGRDRFYEAARTSLAVDGGSVAQAPWLGQRQQNS